MKNTLGLQRGNLVTVDKPQESWLSNKMFVVNAIFEDSIDLKFRLSDSISRVIEIEFIKPVSITPESLGLFDGWQNITKGCITFKIGDLFLRYSPIYAAVQVWLHGNIIATSKYIHELQNIVSALTGEYLQLKKQEK